MTNTDKMRLDHLQWQERHMRQREGKLYRSVRQRIDSAMKMRKSQKHRDMYANK